MIVDEEDNVLDGYNRLRIDPKAPKRVIKGLTEAEKKAFVFQANFARRNLSPAHKKDALRLMKAIAKELREEKNTQATIARRLGVERSTVAKWFETEKKDPTSIVNFHNTSKGANSSPVAPPKLDAKVVVPAAAKPGIYEEVKSGKTQVSVSERMFTGDLPSDSPAAATAAAQA